MLYEKQYTPDLKQSDQRLAGCVLNNGQTSDRLSQLIG